MKNQIIIAFFIFTIFGLSCQENKIRIIETWSENKPKTIVEYINQDDTTDFNLIGLYESGDTNFIYAIRKGKRNGISKLLYENGQVKYIVNYKDDQFHGKSIFWYQNGQIWQIAQYKYGIPVDTLKEYYNDGFLKTIGIFENGAGEVTSYHPNGVLWKRGRIENGKEEGNWIFYYQNASKSSEGTFNIGQREGPYKKYYKTGELMESGNYKLGIITESTHYLKNGDIDHELTAFMKEHKNYTPWSDEQKEALISECINEKLEENIYRGDDYCHCMVGKLEIFWSYQEYLTASEIEYKNLMSIIDKLCDYE